MIKHMINQMSFSRKSEQLMLTIKIVADSEVMADTCNVRFNNFFL